MIASRTGTSGAVRVPSCLQAEAGGDALFQGKVMERGALVEYLREEILQEYLLSQLETAPSRGEELPARFLWPSTRSGAR